jgi:hypothetical protein
MLRGWGALCGLASGGSFLVGRQQFGVLVPKVKRPTHKVLTFVGTERRVIGE